MSINKLYGMNDGIINLVKCELKKDILVSVDFVFLKTKEFFPNEEFSISDISDLIYHLANECV